MLLVIALGFSSLVRRGESATADNLRRAVSRAAAAIAPVAAGNQLVISLGGGPQLSLLLLEATDKVQHEFHAPDGASSELEGMISYMLEQDLGNLLPAERAVATLLTMAEVDASDPAFAKPTTVIGPLYLRDEAEQLAAGKGWSFQAAGNKWRRVVAVPDPQRIVEIRPITWLLEKDVIVIAEGGGGIPIVSVGNRHFAGADCTIDADLASAVLARDLGADLFMLLTDTDAVYVDWGRPNQRPIRVASPDALNALALPARSIGGKVNAASRFVQATGRRAAIGAVHDLARLVAGEAGTTVSPSAMGIGFANAV
jgi:carbamate kinase